MIINDEDYYEDDKDLWEEKLKGKRAKSGIDLDLETAADEILRDARKGTTKHSEMTDYFSPSQIARRMAKEVFPASGIPDPHLVSGLFKRKYSADRSAGPRENRLESNHTFPVTIRKIGDDNAE